MKKVFFLHNFKNGLIIISKEEIKLLTIYGGKNGLRY